MSETEQNRAPKKRPRWAKGFLAAMAQSGNVRLACEAAGIGRTVAYELRATDSDFAADWEHAQEEAADLLEQEARRRAYQGVHRLKFDRGKAIMVPAVGDDGLVIKDENGNPEMIPYVEHEYSDVLLIFLLKATNPGKYRETVNQEHTGAVTITVKYGTDRTPS